MGGRDAGQQGVGWAADGNGDRSGDKGVTVAGLLRRRLCLRGASEPHPLGIRRGKLYVNLEEDIHSNAQCFLFMSWGNRVYLCVGEEKRGQFSTVRWMDVNHCAAVRGHGIDALVEQVQSFKTQCCVKKNVGRFPVLFMQTNCTHMKRFCVLQRYLHIRGSYTVLPGAGVWKWEQRMKKRKAMCK